MIDNIPAGWEYKSLSDIGVVSTSSVDKLVKPDEKIINLINYLDVFNSLDKKITSDINFMRVSARETQLTSNQVHKGDVLFTPSSETPDDIGISAVVYEDLPDTLYSYHLVRLKFKEMFDLNYKCYMFNSPQVLNQFERLSQGLTRYTISLKAFNEIQILIPPIGEQQNIAEILSTVDDAIDNTTEIIEKTQELKKGLMQKLFTEGIGHTRFKDTKVGRIPEEWEVIKVSEITTIKVGRDLIEERFSELKDEIYKYPVYSNTVSNHGLYGYYNKPEYEGNSLTIIGRGVGLGKAFSKEGGFGAIGRLLVLFPNPDVSEIFLSYYINYKKPFFVESSGIPQLTGVEAGKYNVIKPSLTEQEKIAKVLSEVDSKIEKEEATKAELEQLKKGLMQVLLTGKVRVMA